MRIYVNALLPLHAKRFELGVGHLVEPRYPLVVLGAVVSLGLERYDVEAIP